MAERAFEIMCRHANDRDIAGVKLAEKQIVQDWIATSRMEIDQARLLTQYAAWKMDTVGQAGSAPGTVHGQGRRAEHDDDRARPRDPVHGRTGCFATTPRWPPCGATAVRCASPTGPTRRTRWSSPGGSSDASPDPRRSGVSAVRRLDRCRGGSASRERGLFGTLRLRPLAARRRGAHGRHSPPDRSVFDHHCRDRRRHPARRGRYAEAGRQSHPVPDQGLPADPRGGGQRCAVPGGEPGNDRGAGRRDVFPVRAPPAAVHRQVPRGVHPQRQGARSCPRSPGSSTCSRAGCRFRRS